MIQFIKYIFYYIFHTRLFYSLYVCLKYLPFKQAIKVPLLFYPKSKLKMSRGAKIVFEYKVSFRDILIGFGDSNFLKEGTKMTIVNDGLIIFKGKGISICAGCNFHVTKSGIFTLHQGVVLAPMGRYFCCKGITIGRNTRIVHDCQVFDTNFHYLMNAESGDVTKIAKPVVIGEYCWIGNRTTINSGTVLPDGCTVASNSLLNKDYSKIVKPNTILGGIPAKLIREGYIRVWDKVREADLYKNLDEIEY